MFNWLIRRIADRHRKLFSFWDGRRLVRVDPVVIFRRMSENAEFDAVNDFKRLGNPVAKYRVKAIGHMANVARNVFQLPVFDGVHGLTENELVHLVLKFQGEMAELKKNTQPTPEQSPSMEPVTTESDLAAEIATSDSSV